MAYVKFVEEGRTVISEGRLQHIPRMEEAVVIGRKSYRVKSVIHEVETTPEGIQQIVSLDVRKAGDHRGRLREQWEV